MVDQEELIFVTLAAMIALLLMAGESGFGPLGLVVVFICVFALLLILIIDYADFLVFPVFTKVFNIKMIPGKNYVIPKSQDAVVKYVNGLYYVTGYLTGNIYNYVFKAEEVNDKDSVELLAAMDKWERIVMNVDFPFKFNIISMAQDIQKYRDELEGQMGFLEFQMSRSVSATNQNPVDIGDIQKRINIVEAKMDRLGTGEKPLNSIMYIESTAVGVSEKEALDLLDAQMSQLSTVFNAFDLSISRITGREVYFLYKLNYRLYSIDSMMGLFSSQK